MCIRLLSGSLNRTVTSKVAQDAALKLGCAQGRGFDGVDLDFVGFAGVDEGFVGVDGLECLPLAIAIMQGYKWQK